MRLVVRLGEVLDDGTGLQISNQHSDMVAEHGARYVGSSGAYLPEGKASVWVLNGGDTTVDVDLLERWLVHVGHVDEDGLVWKLQLLEDDSDLRYTASESSTIVWRSSMVSTHLPWVCCGSVSHCPLN